jgi:hypothetical protein
MRSFRLGLTMLFTASVLSMAPVGLEFNQATHDD